MSSQHPDIKRRHFLMSMSAAALATQLPTAGAAAARGKRPNFLFILADDMGYADAGCYGGRHMITPTIDRLAREGVKFTDGYANSCVCSPTRFGLATGRYQYRLVGGNTEPIQNERGSDTIGLPPSHPTMMSQLQKAGYRTALIGKWHMGYLPHFSPIKSGYDEFFGAFGGGLDYFSHVDPDGVKDLWLNDVQIDAPGYLTTQFTDRAVDYIGRMSQQDSPFLLSLHYTAPHWPWETSADEATSRRIGKNILHFDGGSVELYHRMVQEMDSGIERVLRELEKRGMADNTVVVFSSDNGGERFSDMWPLRGRKDELWEGGIRVPTIVRWPQQIPAGSVSAQPVLSMDWMPTFLELANASADPNFPLDGMSLVPFLRDPRKTTERDLFWRYQQNNQEVLRRGNWKYMHYGNRDYLFDLSQDQREQANLWRLQPELAKTLKSDFARWSASMLPYDNKNQRRAT